MKISFVPLIIAVMPTLLFVLPSYADTTPPTPTNTAAASTPVTQQLLPAPAFEQVLAHVYETDPQLRSERQSVKILDERVAQANAGFRPTLAFTGEIGEARVSQDNQAWRYGEDKNLSLTAIQPLYNGATIGQRDAAKSRMMAGRAHLLATEQTIMLSIITAWLDMCEKQKLFDLTQDSMRLTQSVTDATQQRLQAGDSTQTDLAVAESRSADATARYAIASSARDNARTAYTRVSGLPPQIADLPTVPLDLPHSSDEAVQLAQNNPVLSQANYELQATDEDIETANGARWPYIYIRGSMSDEHATDLGLERLRTDAITINASVPLYQGGAEYSRVREAKLAHEKSRFDAQNTQRSVTEQAAEAYTNYRTAFAVIDATNQASRSAAKAMSGIDEEHQRGTRTLTEVLDAQMQLLNTQVTEIQAEKNLRLEAFRLLAATGRLTAQGLNLPTTIYDPVPHYDDVATRWIGTDIDDHR